MAIPDEDVAKVRAATDLAALIGEHTSLKRVGRRFVGLCPFHGEKTASFSVNAEEGLYYCFGCQASGDAITFVRAVEGCDFVEAVERLAARAGITVRNDSDTGNEATRGKRQKLYDALGAAAEFYHSYLLSHPDAGRARQYLRARGYDGEIVRRFKIGFAPSGYDAMVKALKLAPAVLLEAGLAYENSQRRLQDAFRERVLFPIFDPGNKVIALGGRVLPEEYRKMSRDPGPKYRNSPESAIYQKRATLYGLNFSKAAISRENEAIVCEGYTDVIGFFVAGLPRAVATCGTALTEDHFRLLARFAKRVVLCFDGDSAGRNAAARIYEWERRHELELAVAGLASGSDPGDLGRTNPEALRQAIAKAKPFLGFLVDRALAQADLQSPEGRMRAAESALGAIAEHPNELIRDQYLIELADKTRLGGEALRELLNERRLLASQEREHATSSSEHGSATTRTTDGASGFSQRFGEPSASPVARSPAASGHRSSPAGRDALVLAIHRPAEVAQRFSDALFVEPIEREAFQALASEVSLHEAIAHAGPDAADLLSRLAVADESGDIDIDGTFISLVRIASTRALAEVDSGARLNGQADEEGLVDASATTRWLKEELEQLRDPILRPGHRSPAVDAAERLLAWLEGRNESER